MQNNLVGENLTVDSFLWLIHLANTAGLLKQALQELTLDDIIELWAKKTRKPKQRGRHIDEIYIVAWHYEQYTKKAPMVIFRELVLPALIELEWIQLDTNGEPDPPQEQEAKKSYLKARARFKKGVKSP